MLRYGYNRAHRHRRHHRVGHAGAGHPAFAGADRAGRPTGPLRRRHVRRRDRSRPAAGRAFLRLFIVIAGHRPAELGAGAAAGGAHLWEANGASGHRSLLVLLVISAAAGFAWAACTTRIINPLVGRERPAPTDEVLILSMTVGVVHRPGAGARATALFRLGAAVAAHRAGHLRADSAAGADLPGAGHDLPRHRHADRRRGDGRDRRADHGRLAPPAELRPAQAGAGQHGEAGLLRACSS